MRVLVLNRRPIIEKMALWFSEAEIDIFLVTPKTLLYPLEKSLNKVYGNIKGIYPVEDYDSPLVNNLILKLIEEKQIDRIVSATEIDVLRAAKLREKTGLMGQNEISALAYRNKWIMKSLLKKNKIPVAKMRQVTDRKSVEKFVDECGFPIVIKPVDGGGSVGVQIIHHAAQLQDINFELLKSGYLVEEWIEGEFFTIDGLMRNGEMLHCWPSHTTANFSAVNGDSALLSWMLLPDNPLTTKLSGLMSQVIMSLPPTPDTTAFHAEAFFCEKTHRLVMCEIACRPGGAGHVPVYEMAFGLNLYKETLFGQAGLRAQETYQHIQPKMMAGFAWFPPKEGVFRYAPSSCPVSGIVDYQLMASTGRHYQAPGSISDHIAKAFALQAVDRDPAEVITEVDAWWKTNVIWENEASKSNH
ncbi:ATP-grasp domain-containing protein [Xenorhabdus szentirmaii]|uniref:ATP-grasp domain-containing protein n=1 Tax=Xenorhabdus szentirmaii TaxID=290112 RepID=A0AAW3YQ44_9GAMM|nr:MULTISPECIES: ATP-grasp domain-containing protein [unclassified Xenorhabdus]MBD2779645.1 ATP-grasp domain-containing protein [Xenorhabdus sp. 38]MBD2799486.1 ATP-grasp domain-containing protein [Xenorhabdus sp. M]